MSLRAAQAVAALCTAALALLCVPAVRRVAGALVPTPEARGTLMLGILAVALLIGAAFPDREEPR